MDRPGPMPSIRRWVERRYNMMGTLKVLAAGLAAVLALLFLTATAQAVDWRIERMSGNVQIFDNESWARLGQDRKLNAGDSIWTGRNGRVLLRNDHGSVLLAPMSIVKIPAQALPDNFSVLFQSQGKVSAEVNKRHRCSPAHQNLHARLRGALRGTPGDRHGAGARL